MTTQATLDGGTMVETEEDEVLNELTSKLEEIFQFDKRDLDFGMYRVLKLRRAEVEAFMVGLAGEVRAILGEAPAAERIEVCNHLVEFFSRYYREGDFMTLPRRSETKPEYAVPYWGEEVILHWANRDQYYIKTGRSFRMYEFQDDGGQHTVRFTIVESETPLNNIQDEKCYFIPAGAEYDEGTQALTVRFEYRPADPDKKAAAKKKATKNNTQESFIDQAYTIALAAAPDSLRPKISRPPENDRRGAQESRPLLRVHLDRYTAENSEDFFIHKDLAGFLRRELDFYLKNAVIHLDALTSGNSVDLSVATRKATAIKSIANHVIEMLDTTETMQRRLFEKKKLVVSADYCMTLDRVPEELYAEIAENDDQANEWKNIFGVDVCDRSTLAKSAVERMKACPSLVLDTRHFGEGFKDRLLASFDDLDEAVEGLMIKSENWQALNLLQTRYGGQMQCIYVDPPYNTDASPIHYKNNYKNSSWIAILYDRIKGSKKFLKENGVFVCAIDDMQLKELGYIISDIFHGRDLGTIVVRSNPSGRPKPTGYSVSHEYLLFAGQSSQSFIGHLPPTPDQLKRFNQRDELSKFEWRNLRREGSNSDRNARRKLYYPIFIKDSTIRVPEMEWNEDSKEWILLEQPQTGEQVVYPNNDEGREKTWRWEANTVKNSMSALKVRKDRTGQDYVYYKRRPHEEGVITISSWFDAKYSATEHGTAILKDLFGDNPFTYPKSLFAVIDAIFIGGASKPDSTTLDFFAGTGTTAHAVLNLNREDGGHRKYILVEMGEHFATVMKPRIMRVMYAKAWKNGQPVIENGSPDGQSHIFKYIALEQYEDTLANIALPSLHADEQTLFANAPDRLLTYLLDRAGTGTVPDATAFEHPFAITLRLHRETLAHPDDGLVGSSQIRPRSIDLPETFAYLLGLHIVHRQAFYDDNRRYLVYLGRRNHEGHVIVIWRDTTHIDYAADRTFITTTVLPSLRAGLAVPETELYINGEAWVENAQSIGPAFTSLLETKEV